MMISKYQRIVLLELFALILIVIYILIPPTKPSSLLSKMDLGKAPASREHYYQIMGFVPYWHLKKIVPSSLSTITQFSYFALHLDGNGSIQTHLNSRELEPGYLNYLRLLKSPPEKPLILTFMQSDQAALSDLLANPLSRRQAVKTIKEKVIESRAQGVNIDFEPTLDNQTSSRQNFTRLIQELRDSLCSPTLHQECPLITISVYPSAATNPRIWDLQSLGKFVDYLVVMTYDYTLPKSASSGPISPLRDVNNLFEHNIIKNIAEISTLVPPRKILLGIPFYGYEWETIDNTRYSKTLGRGATASLERIQKMLDEHTLELVWDRNSLTPYAVTTSSGQTTQIYFDNEASLRLKLDFVKDANLGGIAIWALGYENGVDWLWPLISKLNN